MPREIVLRPQGKLTAAWLDRVAIEGGSLFEGRQVVAEDVGRVTVKDTDVPGLEMRLTGGGVRSWAVSKRVNGIQRRFTLPEGARLSLAEARRNAIKLLDAIADGRDPTAERRETRKQAQLARLGIGRAWTLEALVEEYGAKVAAPAKQKSWLDRRAHILREFRDLAALPAAEITDAHLWRVLDAATARDAQVSGWHALRYLRTVLGWALSRKLIERDPTTDLPLKDIRGRMKERTRERVLSPDELGRLWRTLEASPGDVYSAIYRVAALTAQRVGEVAGMQWEELDLARGEWRQRTNKSDRPHLVPLSAEALDVIRAQLRRERKAGGKGRANPEKVPFVFATSTGGRLDRRSGNWHRATDRFAAASGVSEWGPHDLRRTAATILAEAKVAPVVIEQLLNHAEGAGKGSLVAAIYNRHSYGMEKRQAVELLAKRIRALAVEQWAEVIEIRPARRVG
jgi:integrase